MWGEFMSPAIRQRPEGIPSPIFSIAAPLSTPQMLRIDRYRLKPGTELPVNHLQQQLALAFSRHNYPHPCLAIESLSGPREIWRIAGYQSPAEQRNAAQVLDANTVLRLDLERIDTQIRVLVGDPSTMVANYCGGAGRRRAWPMGRGHYLIVTPLAP